MMHYANDDEPFQLAGTFGGGCQNSPTKHGGDVPLPHNTGH